MRQAWLTLSVVSLASVFSGMATSALNVALPTVVRHFSADATAASWILLSFMLIQTLLLVTFGRIADMFGRRRMYLPGLAVFTAASLAAGLAPSAWALVGLRAVQAAGAAMLLAISAALVTDAFPRHRLGQGMGIYLASFSVAQLLGPTVGGFLAANAGWRWLFWYNVPVGVLCLVWGAFALRPSPRPAERATLDLTGNLMLFATLGVGLVGLSQATSLGWTDPLVLGGLGLSAALIPVFLWLERRARHPLIDLSLFADRSFGYGLAASFLNPISQVGVILLIALYFQAVTGQDPLTAGLRVLPVAMASLVFSSTSGLVQRFIPASALAAVGNLITAVGVAILFVSVGPQVNDLGLTVGMVLAGAGSGLFMPSNTTAILARVPSNQLGVANAMRLTLLNVGFVLGTALILSILTSPLPLALRRYALAGTMSEVSGEGLEMLLTGFQWALLTMVAVAVLAAAASAAAWRARRQPPPNPDRSPSAGVLSTTPRTVVSRPGVNQPGG
jgi:EmrB/QacA subfamily drug resistance transporter